MPDRLRRIAAPGASGRRSVRLREPRPAPPCERPQESVARIGHADAELARRGRGIEFRFNLADVLERMQHIADRTDQGVGARCRQHAFVGADEQRVAELLPELAETDGDRWLAETQFLGGARHMAIGIASKIRKRRRSICSRLGISSLLLHFLMITIEIIA